MAPVLIRALITCSSTEDSCRPTEGGAYAAAQHLLARNSQDTMERQSLYVQLSNVKQLT